ncbi:MAG TPA: lytic transglycosylase domain-containing protein [Candidatus Acidoferrum sp.]|nr:lytic transglycosylase domain-containing protein [Candidatus Acidoferrum sp.]
MRMLKAAALLIVCTSFLAPRACAEYAVLRSGMRIHITGYENLGSIVRLHVSGGTVDVAVEDVLNIEPEEVFVPMVAPPAAKSVSTEHYPELIGAAARKYGLDPLLLAAVAEAESNFDPRAVSRKNAQGVMQLLPQTSARLAVQNPFDPAQSIEAGARYLRELLDRFHENVNFALAAYNAGPERVEQYGGIPPYRETQDYVARITQRARQKSKALSLAQTDSAAKVTNLPSPALPAPSSPVAAQSTSTASGFRKF